MNSIVIETLEIAFPDVREIEGFLGDLSSLEAVFRTNTVHGKREKLRDGVRALLAGR